MDGGGKYDATDKHCDPEQDNDKDSEDKKEDDNGDDDDDRDVAPEVEMIADGTNVNKQTKDDNETPGVDEKPQ